ncbi:hypothetical protein JX266_010137 [Neoarthrinium moseri]|nr:hypothetical protein JX266_010137 [Neoarthrinium moseri]
MKNHPALKKYPPLLPASAPRNHADSTPSSSTSDETIKRRRVGVQVACNACRTKKTRCDGERPTCSPCQRRGTECAWSDKREPNDETLEVLELLKSAPEKTAIDILRLLRTSGDVRAVLSMVNGGMDGKHRPSDRDASLAMTMSAQSPLELELMVRNPNSYPTLRPISEAALEESNLLRPVNLARYDSHEQSSVSDFLPDLGGGSLTDTSGADADSAVKLLRKSPMDGIPPQLTRYCDGRLADLRIEYWTRVPIPNNFAASILSLYLETDHPLLGLFDPDKFIGDLVNRRERFCSSFLVASVLYWGCQMYSALDKGANEYLHQFCTEAERLWSLNRLDDSPLNMAGAQLLSLAYMGHGKDHLVLRYLKDAVEMGTRMGLLGVDNETAARKLDHLPEETRQAYAYAAWGVFNWAVLISLFYQQPGLEYPVYPPMLPIPGEDGAEDLGGLGMFDTPPPRPGWPAYMGKTLTTLCQFWRIMHGVSMKYFSRVRAVDYSNLELEFAEMKFREILAWAENLPRAMLLTDTSPHHVVVFHIWLHASILDILRPFIIRQKFEHVRLRTFSADLSTPAAACKASVNQLKHLIVHFRSHYESSTYTFLWHTALTYVANAVLQDADDPAWRLYFLLCIYGYESLRRPFRVSAAIGMGLLSMILRDRDMTSLDARRLLGELNERGLNHVQGAVRATFMGDLDLAQTDPEAATVEHLADQFEGMALLREWTIDGVDATMT